MSETRELYQIQGETENGSARPLPPPEPLRLLEPDLSYYRAIRAQFDAAQIQAATLAQALGALNPVLMRRYGLGPEDMIDAEGFIHRQAEPAR